MPRASPTHRQPRFTLGIACAILLILSILPAAWLRPVGFLGSVADLIVAPVQAPVSACVRWLLGKRATATNNDPEVKRIQSESDTFKTLYLKSLDDNARLQRQIVQLQRGLALNPGLIVRQLIAPVIGLQADGNLLQVRAGSTQGVNETAIAVYDGVHLIGRVVAVEPRISRVLPLTDKSSGLLDAIIIPGESTPDLPPDALAAALNCPLRPAENGRLRGPVEVAALRQGAPAPEIKPGQVVRLRGERWPRAARMLVIGIIERVDTAANNRPIITVKPVFELASLSEVTLLLPDQTDSSKPSGEGGAP